MYDSHDLWEQFHKSQSTEEVVCERKLVEDLISEMKEVDPRYFVPGLVTVEAKRGGKVIRCARTALFKLLTDWHKVPELRTKSPN